MCASTQLLSAPVASPSLQSRFLAIVPRIERHACIYFRQVRCRDRREDCIAETTALAWKWFVRLMQRGKDVTGFVSALAIYAARAVQSGRRLTGMEQPKDVMSPIAQRRRGFSVTSLPERGLMSEEAFADALTDNDVSTIPDQVAFRQDFPRWRRRRSHRDRQIIRELMIGERTLDVARRYGLSAARISQKRVELLEDWRAFCA
jgi:hypothetical protein